MRDFDLNSLSNILVLWINKYNGSIQIFQVIYWIEYKLFVQRIGLVGITNILIALSSLILLPILTKGLSITEYGTWVLIMTTIALIPNVANLGLPYTMVRFFICREG